MYVLPWLIQTCLYPCLTIYRSLRATNMLQFLINIDLKPHANFHENPIKPSVSLSCCSLLRAFVFISFQYFKFPMSNYRRKTAEDKWREQANCPQGCFNYQTDCLDLQCHTCMNYLKETIVDNYQ